MISCQYSIIYDLPEDDIFTSLTLYEDVIYLATECNGIYTYNINTGEINNEYKLYANGHSGPSHTINHIYTDDTGVYAGSTNGLYIFETNGSKKHFTADSYDQYSLINNYISYIMKDSSGLLWIGTFSGINTVDCNSGISYYNNFVIEQNMKTNIVMGTYEDVDEKLWLGGSNKEGLIKFNPKDSSLNLFKYSHLANSISDNTILSIAEDSEGNMWFGTESGLNKHNKQTGEFKIYSIEDNLSNNTIYSIIPLDDKIWITTNSGINCLEFKNGQLINVRKLLTNVEFSSNSFHKTKNGKYAFGAFDGLYIIDPVLLEKNISSPAIHFHSVSVNGNELDINDLSNISIGYKENFMTINLFTNIYSNIQNVNFYYRINNNKWTLMHGNEVTLSNLADNKYTIDFIAKKSNGSISDIKSISFNVKPPFWRCKCAKFVYFLLLFVVIIYIILKIAHLRNAIFLKNKQLAKEIKEKNELLEKNIELEKRKNNYLINMSHELRTPLNVIGATQQLIVNLNKEGNITSEKLSKYMKISDNNLKRLLGIINNLIDSTKLNEGMYNLLIEENNIIYVIEEAALSLKTLAEEKEIDLIVDTNTEECIMKFDRDSIERCIINVVGNAIKFTNSCGKILVNIIDSPSVLTIEISDNGSGIPPEKIAGIFDRFSQVINSKREFSKGSGLGLTITKGLIELHGGDITVTSELGKGTSFTIVLPKNI